MNYSSFPAVDELVHGCFHSLFEPNKWLWDFFLSICPWGILIAALLGNRVGYFRPSIDATEITKIRNSLWRNSRYWKCETNMIQFYELQLWWKNLETFYNFEKLLIRVLKIFHCYKFQRSNLQFYSANNIRII